MYYRANVEQRRAKSRRWTAENRARAAARARRKYAARPEVYRERARRSRARHQERISARNLRRRLARSRNHDQISADYALILRADPCSYCGRPVDHIDHIDPIFRGGDGHWTNLTGACVSCNTSKQHKRLLIFLLERLPA